MPETLLEKRDIAYRLRRRAAGKREKRRKEVKSADNSLLWRRILARYFANAMPLHRFFSHDVSLLITRPGLARVIALYRALRICR